MLPQPLGHFWAKFGQIWANFGQIWAKFGQNLDFQIALIGWIKAGPPKKPLLF